MATENWQAAKEKAAVVTIRENVAVTLSFGEIDR